MLGKVLVTGGAGCLGSHIVELLHEKRDELGVQEIVVLDLLDNVRWASPEDDKRIKGYCSSWIKASVTDGAAVNRAVSGCNVVIHTASMVDTGSAPTELLFQVNVKGTRNVIDACVNEPTVRALVYSSSMDVVVHINDFEDKDGCTEDGTTYAIDDPHLRNPQADVYCISKTLAEKEVLKANRWNVDRLRTAAIRPVGLYGERDSVHIGSVLEAGRNMGSMMLFRFGDGSAVFQHVYVRNCAWMHILAAKKLVEGNDKVAGQAFFGIDNTKVNNFFDFFEPYLAAKGYRVPSIRIPYSIAFPLAALTEDIFHVLKWIAPSVFGKISLKFTRRAIQGTCITAWFNTEKAKNLLDYTPLVSPMEARRQSIEFFRKLTAIYPQGPYKYLPGQHTYIDTGLDFKPEGDLYLERKKSRQTGKRSLVPLLLGLTLTSGTCIGFMTLRGHFGATEQKRFEGLVNSTRKSFADLMLSLK